MDIEKINIIGAIVSIYIMFICILIFTARLLSRESVEYWLGIFFILSVIPLSYLLYTALQFNRPSLYYIQICLMILFIIVELLLDYLLKSDFRNIRWMVITYATLFFVGTGGMIGVASNAGKLLTIIAVVLYLIMTVLAFVQRAKTGM